MTTSTDRQFSMHELVARTGISAGTVRYYLAAGLLPPPVRESVNRFLYDDRHVEAIRLVRLLRERRGLSLEAIARLLPDLLPDLVGQPDAGTFRPEMWGEVIATHSARLTGPSVTERLVDAGVSAFCKDGFAEVTIDDVCRATEIAKGSFYRHFPSKEELFFAVCRTIGERIVARFSASTSHGAADEGEALEALTDAIQPFAPPLFELAAEAARHHGRHELVFTDVARTVNLAARGHLTSPLGSRLDLFAAALGAAACRSATEQGASPAPVAARSDESGASSAG